MLGCAVKGYTKACSDITGGVSRLFVGDANDFDFTLAAPVDGEDVGYSTVARRTGATAEGGANLYEISSIEDTIGVEINQSNPEGSSSAWEYVITARLAQMSQQMTNFTRKLDAAAVCCQLVFIWQMNDGTIFVAGERYVGGTQIIRFKLRQDGSKASSGKKFTEFNGLDLSIKGSYFRMPYAFTGGFSVLQALMPEE